MKHFKNIFTALLVMIAMVSCETYGDYEVEYTPIHPLSGQYRITVYDQSNTEIYRNYCYIANTVDNAKDKCWIRIGAYNASSAMNWSINGKINCDVSSLSFSGSAENLAGNVTSSSETMSVTNGIIVLNGTTAPSGTTTDKISFTFTNSRFPGETFRAEGYRYTGWGSD